MKNTGSQPEPGDHRLIRQPIGVRQMKQPRNRCGGVAGRPLPDGKNPDQSRAPPSNTPVDQRRKLHQRVPQVDHVNQPRTQQVILFQRARVVLHDGTGIVGFRRTSHEALQAVARKAPAFQRKINSMDVVQDEPSTAIRAAPARFLKGLQFRSISIVDAVDLAVMYACDDFGWSTDENFLNNRSLNPAHSRPKHIPFDQGLKLSQFRTGRRDRQGRFRLSPFPALP